jgi:hypothetical protein
MAEGLRGPARPPGRETRELEELLGPGIGDDGPPSGGRDGPGASPHRSAEDGPFGWARRWLGVLEKAVSEAAPDRVLSYREVVGYLAANRPAGPEPVRGALLRRRRTGAWDFRVLYLDEASQPLTDQTSGRPMGYTVLARDCDRELHDMFGNNDLIIFE